MSHAFPGDPLGRAWIEVSGTNPILVDQYRPSLISFLAFDRGQVAKFAGTGFVIRGNENEAIVITARHVLDYVGEVQRPQSNLPPSIKPQHLKAVWMGDDHAVMLNVVHASLNPTTDVAACVIAHQETSPPPFAPISIPLHPIVPRVGQVVRMVSLDKMIVDEISPPEDRDGKDLGLRVFRVLASA